MANTSSKIEPGTVKGAVAVTSDTCAATRRRWVHFQHRLANPRQSDEHPRKSAAARREVLMGQITVTTRQKRDHRNHKLRLDDLEKSHRFQRFQVTNSFSHHPREAEGKHRVGLDPVLRGRCTS